MKKFFCWTFWLTVVGCVVYFYKTSPQMRDCCSVIKKKTVELFNEMNCCSHHHKEDGTEEA